MAYPATARASVLTGTRGDFRVQEYPVPPIEPGAILVRTELAGICATDPHVYEGHWKTIRYPVVLGHENVGIVEELGAGVDKDFLGKPLRVGDRVVFKAGSCGRCSACVLGGGGRGCLNRAGSYGFAGPATEAPHFTGGFGEVVYLNNPYTEVFKTELDAQTAVLTEPTAVCVSAVMRAGIELGDTVVIQGAGAIGLLTLACARMAGSMRTILVGGPSRRLELAREMGADHTIDIFQVTDPTERVKRVRALTPGGEGADVVFGAVGKAPAVPEGMRFLKKGTGRMIELGNALESGPATFSPSADLVEPSLTLVGHWATSTPHWVRALRVLESGRAPFRDLVSHKIPLERLGDAVKALLTNYELDGEGAVKIAVAPNGV
ncbi:MAG: zinc-binding alcohol dehydrogenase [Chloroflexota bacterium]|nr:MAG: zinc-binding alcohol dehydrogenase [Chloroflexota bacterium]